MRRVRKVFPKTLRGWACAVATLDIVIFLIALAVVWMLDSPNGITVTNNTQTDFRVRLDSQAEVVPVAETVDLDASARDGAELKEISWILSEPRWMGFVLQAPDGLDGLKIVVEVTEGSAN
jgi:hypothetical protein